MWCTFTENPHKDLEGKALVLHLNCFSDVVGMWLSHLLLYLEGDVMFAGPSATARLSGGTFSGEVVGSPDGVGDRGTHEPWS